MEQEKLPPQEAAGSGTCVSLPRLFLIFFKIGVFTFGGGLAMIPFLQTELVERRKWLDNHLFLDYLALSQSLPGPIIVNLAVINGYRLRGTSGSLISLLGMALPSFVIILMISVFLWPYRDNQLVLSAFQGVRPAVAALIAAAAVKLGLIALRGRPALFLLFALFLGGLIVFHIHPLFVIVAGALAGLLLPLPKAGVKE